MHRLLDPPWSMAPSHAGGVFFTVFLVALFVATGGACVRIAVRDRELLAPVCLVSGLLAVGWEPIVDVNAHVFVPVGTPWHLFTAYGRPMPVYAPFAYGFFFGAISYLVLVALRRGGGGRTLWRIYGVILVADLVAEYPGLWTHAFTHYGPMPLDLGGYPVWWVPVNAATPVVGACLVAFLAPRLPGARALLALPAIPAAYGIANGVAAWPTWLALNSPVPAGVRIAVAVLTMCLAAGLVWALACAIDLGERIRRPGEALFAP